jgi:hypothetical protein
MSTSNTFTATDKAGFVDDAPDIAPLGPRPIKHLQNNSPEVTKGDPAYVSGAEGGDFLVRRSEEMVLYKGTTGVEAIFVWFEEYFVEWPPVRGRGSGGPLARYSEMPSDAKWVLDPATDRKVCQRVNRNKVEKTIYGHALIDQVPATFVFRATAYPIGRAHANLSFHVKATIDGEEIRVIGAKWRVTSHLDSNNLGSWFVPQIDLIGKFGSPKGPTLAEIRAAKVLRIALKTGAEPPALSPGSAAPALEATPKPMPKRSLITVTSGESGGNAPPPSPPPPDHYDGPDDDNGF